MSKVTRAVYEIAQPIADELGLTLIEVLYERKHNGMNLTIVIDKEGGVDINDCEKLHRAVDAPLEELNPTDDQPYILNVSSPGLTRPLTLPWDFKKHMGKEIEVKLYAPLDGKKVFRGILADFADPEFTIEACGKRMVFDRTKTAGILPVIKF